jgi:predicted transcriptional regulator
MTQSDDTSPIPVAASDIVADAKAWLADIGGGQRLQTHSGNCHKWHSTCLVGKLVREIERLRGRPSVSIEKRVEAIERWKDGFYDV